MHKTFTMHTDPGHGYLQVSTADLKDIGLDPMRFSRYSYRDLASNGDTPDYYLEEDMDAVLFIAYYYAKHGREPAYIRNYHDNDAPCRRFYPCNGVRFSATHTMADIKTMLPVY